MFRKNQELLNHYIHAFNPHQTRVSDYLIRGGGNGPPDTFLFLHSKQKNTYQGTLGTQELTPIRSQTSLGPSMKPTGPLKWTVQDPTISEPISVVVYHFYIVHYLAPLTILEHFLAHCGTLSGPKELSWTIKDPKMGPARQISGDLW